MQEMNKCPRCGSILVAHETAQAIDGKIYCSRFCALLDLADRFIQDKTTAGRYNDAMEVAKDYFDDHFETIRTEDVLAEDLQEVQIAVTYFKTVKIPKCIKRSKALEVVEHMWNNGTITAEPGDCDDVRFECELVDRHNSSCEEVHDDRLCAE